MKTSESTLLLLVIGIFLGTTQTAIAQRGSETATGNFFDDYITPTASGQKIEGTLAMTYIQSSLCCTKDEAGNNLPNDENCLDPQTDMHYSFRLSKGNNTYPFSSVLTKVCFSSETEKQAETIIGFINSTVIPIIFQQPPTEGGFNNVWFVKSIKNIAQPDFQLNYNGIFCCGTPPYLKDIHEFLMLDIELAVPR